MRIIVTFLALVVFGCSSNDETTCTGGAGRLDEAANCLRPESVSWTCKKDTPCLTAETCSVRESDGAVMWFHEGCSIPGFRACNAAEQTKSQNAPVCGVDAGTSCPAVATACPAGCGADNTQQIDPVGKCLLPSTTVSCIAPGTGCTGAIVCLTRESDGVAFWFTGDCHTPGWRACTESERAVASDGPSCTTDAAPKD